MKTVVVDSSVIVKWINQIDEALIDQADKLLTNAQKGLIKLIAPELSKYEVGNALLRKKLDFLTALESIDIIHQLPITFIAEIDSLAKETYVISSTHQITYYDAAFLSLAKQYNATLVTDNIKHQGKDKTINVIPLSEY